MYTITLFYNNYFSTVVKQVIYIDISNYFDIIYTSIYMRQGGGCVAKIQRFTIPEYHSITEFLRGQASRIFTDIKEQDKIVIVNKQNKPQAVIISYDRYIRLKEKESLDI